MSEQEKNKQQENNQQQSGQQKNEKNALEWSVFGVSVLVVASVLVFLTYKTITHIQASPDLYVLFWPDPSPHAPHRYFVELHNMGGETAEAVKVELALQKNGKEEETAEMEVQFAPESSKRQGWVTFYKDPAQADTIVARVVSYKRP